MLTLAASLLLAVQLPSDDFTAPRDASVDASGAREIRIVAKGGTLRVTGRDGAGRVEARGTARASRREWLDEIRLEARRTGDVVEIEVVIPDRRWDADDRGDHRRLLDLVVDVPAGARLDVTDGSGDLEIRHVGALDLKDGSGGIRIEDVTGDLRVADGSGELEVRDVKGGVTVTDGSGEIVLRGISGTARVASDGSGSIEADRVGGDFVVEQDGSGSIDYRDVTGSVRIPSRKRRG